MRAFSTASGGVMFVPDEIERISKKVSFKDLVKEEPVQEKPSFMRKLFGRKKTEKENRVAA